MEEENKVKITNPERILRLMRRICSAKLNVFIRLQSDTSVVVKGTAVGLMVTYDQNEHKTAQGFFMNNISLRGVQHLKGKDVVQIEFVMTSAKVMFMASVLKLNESSILVSMPKVLVSLERRKNARCKCTNDLTAHLHLENKPTLDQMPAFMPIFPHNAFLSQSLSVVDISVSGICLHTNFPGFHKILAKGSDFSKSSLVLPMQKSINIGIKIMWIKKIKEHISLSQSQEGVIVSYRYGCEFFNTSDEATHQVKRFMQQLTNAEAI